MQSKRTFRAALLAVASLCLLVGRPLLGGLPETLDRLAVMAASYGEQLPRVRAQQAASTRVFDAQAHQLQESLERTEVSLQEWFAFFTVFEYRHREHYHFSFREAGPELRRIEFWPMEPEPPVFQSKARAPQHNPLSLTASMVASSHTVAWTCDARGWVELDARTGAVTRAHLEAIGLPVSRRVWLRKVTLDAFTLDVDFEPQQLSSPSNLRLNLPRNLRIEIRSNQGRALIERRLEQFAWSEATGPARR